MPNGIASVTLDMINPDFGYYYNNFQPCCATCNRRKQRTDFQTFIIRQAEYKKWEKRKKHLQEREIKYPKHIQTNLFGD